MRQLGQHDAPPANRTRIPRPSLGDFAFPREVVRLATSPLSARRGACQVSQDRTEKTGIKPLDQWGTKSHSQVLAGDRTLGLPRVKRTICQLSYENHQPNVGLEPTTSCSVGRRATIAPVRPTSTREEGENRTREPEGLGPEPSAFDRFATSPHNENKSRSLFPLLFSAPWQDRIADLFITSEPLCH